MMCRKKALFKSCAKYLLNSISPVCVPNAWASGGGDALSFSISRRIAAEKQPNKQVIDAAAAAAAA